jgi:hypothetical protein
MGDKGRTGAFFDNCRYLQSRCQLRHGLVRAWADILRQRTTLDVLNVQYARVALVTAQHDGVVASYTLLAALGGPLHAKTEPQRAHLQSDGHYQQRLDWACLIPMTDRLTARFAR